MEGLDNRFDTIDDAMSVYMLSPTGLCLGLNGDLFVSDVDRHLVFRIFNMWKSVEVYAGYLTNGNNGDGLKAVGTLLNRPSALSVNPLNGDLFIADSANNLIRIVSNSTKIISSIPYTFNNPQGVYVSSNGFVYISDTDNNLIKKYEISTQQISIIGGGGDLDGSYDNVDAKRSKLQSPKNIFVVSNGEKDVIYFTDSERLKSIDENGKYRIVGAAQSNLYGVFVSSEGEIYTSLQFTHFVQMKLLNSDETKLSIGGTIGYDGDNQQYDSGNVKFNDPTSLVVTQNSIIVADKSNRCIRKIDLQNKMVSTLAGGLINHSFGENISPFNMYSPSGIQITFPFYFSNDLYFVDRGVLLRKVSNGKMTTLLGCESQPTYSANIPQRVAFTISSTVYIGNGDVLLLKKDIGYYNFNVETQNLTTVYIYQTKLFYNNTAIAVVGDSFENSTIYIRDSTTTIQVLQQTTIVKTLSLTFNVYASNQIAAIPNLRYPDSNSLFLYALAENILVEIIHFKNGSMSLFEIQIPAPTPSFFSGFSVNTAKSLLIWSTSQLYDLNLESYSLKKIGGLDYFKVSNSIVQIYGFNGEDIPIESSALYLPTAYRFGSKILVANRNYLSEISNGKIRTIAGGTPATTTSNPLIFMRDSVKKISYYIDTRTVKKLDESNGKATSISTSLQSSNGNFIAPYLTLNIQSRNTGNHGIFSKLDRKLYIKDNCRIIRMDPETTNFEVIIGNGGCFTFVIGVKGFESPCPVNINGITIDDNGDLLIATTELTIIRYSVKTQIISLDFAFAKSDNISSDGVITNQTNPGNLVNLHYQDGNLYLLTSSAIRKIEKQSDNTFYLRTLVGNSITGYKGDKLPALESSLDNPSAMYIKKNGDIIILDGSGNFIVRMFQKQSGLLVNIAGSRSVAAKFNGDGFGTYSAFTSFTKQVGYNEDTGEIFLIDAKSYIRKVVPKCATNYSYNSWNNTCDLTVLSCNGTSATNSSVCNGNGICSDFDTCQCKNGFEGQFCEIQKIITDSTNHTVLIVSIVVPIVASLLILLVVLILIIEIVLICFKKKAKRNEFEIARLDAKNVELSDTDFPSSSIIISSSAGSSVNSDISNPLSKYSNIERIGSGAFGSVYKVTDVKDNKMKAIKTVKFESLTDLNTIMKEASQEGIEDPGIATHAKEPVPEIPENS